MARGSLKSDLSNPLAVKAKGSTQEEYVASEYALTEKAVNRELGSAKRSLKTGLANIADARSKAEAYLAANQKELDDLYAKHTEIQFNYYGSDGMVRERVYLNGTTEAQKAAVTATYAENKVRRQRVEKIDADEAGVKQRFATAEAKAKSLKENLPDMPALKKTNDGYYSLDEVRTDPIGRLQMMKFDRIKIEEATRKALRQVGKDAYLEGEDNDYFSGKLKSDPIVLTGIKGGKMEIVVEAQVDYENNRDPRGGDSRTTVGDYKVLVKRG